MRLHYKKEIKYYQLLCLPRLCNLGKISMLSKLYIHNIFDFIQC